MKNDSRIDVLCLNKAGREGARTKGGISGEEDVLENQRSDEGLNYGDANGQQKGEGSSKMCGRCGSKRIRGKYEIAPKILA